jgi:hypothetical protein
MHTLALTDRIVISAVLLLLVILVGFAVWSAQEDNGTKKSFSQGFGNMPALNSDSDTFKRCNMETPGSSRCAFMTNFEAVRRDAAHLTPINTRNSHENNARSRNEFPVFMAGELESYNNVAETGSDQDSANSPHTR